MKFKIWIIFLSICAIILAGCGNDGILSDSVYANATETISTTTIPTTTTTTEPPTTTTTIETTTTTIPVTTTTAKPIPKPTTTLAPAPQVSSGGFLDCVKNRESRGDYGAVNGSSGAGGAYQFLQSTWNNTAAHIGRTDLIGVHPSQASPADQDMMANALLNWYGRSPWQGPGC